AEGVPGRFPHQGAAAHRGSPHLHHRRTGSPVLPAALPERPPDKAALRPPGLLRAAPLAVVIRQCLGGGHFAGAVKPSAPTVTSAVCFSSATGRILPSRSSTTDASEYQEGMTACPQKSRRRGSSTDQRSTGWSGSPV